MVWGAVLGGLAAGAASGLFGKKKTSQQPLETAELQEARRELRRHMRMPGISQEEKERRMDDWKRRVAKIKSDVESANRVKLK